MAWWPLSLHRPQPHDAGRGPTTDPVGETLRAAVAAHARAKAANVQSYETRVQGMIDDLFSRMERRHARHDP